MFFTFLTIGTARAGNSKKFIGHLNTGFVAANWVGAQGANPSRTFTLDERQSILQLVGGGYFVRPNLRLMMSLQFIETVGGRPANVSPFSLFGIIPWVGWHPIASFPQFFVGTGPLLAPRNYGQNEFDVGIWSTAGVGFPIGKGFSLGGLCKFLSC